MRLAFALVLASAPAYAQHDHAEDHHATAPALAAGVSLVAASFDTMLYLGNYQGVIPSLRWSNARFSAIASGAVYRLEKNGATFYGIGDAAVHGHAQLVSSESFAGGLALGVSVPTGNHRRGNRHGIGMGHLMVMPAVFAGWAASRLRAGASVGYSRALGSHSHDDHGPWPLVSPMLSSEISWNAGGELLVTPRLATGVRGSGGIPVGDGDARALIAARVAWRADTLESAFELQAGVVGDPFTVRGVVSTALSF